MDTDQEVGTLRKLRRRAVEWLESLQDNETQLTLVLSILIGALVGLVVVAFILLTGRLAGRMYPAGGSGWRRILVPIIGSLVSGYLLYRYFPFARGSGIPQTKSALLVSDGRISLKTVLGKFSCCTLTLASGIALGREGPSVHVGAGIASVIGRRLGLNTGQIKSLVPAACSAALAAAFNTPIAAVLFTLEEILGNLHAPVLGSIVLSSATSWMVLNLVLGDELIFHVSGYELVHWSEFAIYAVLGVVGGLGSVAFVKLLLNLRLKLRALPGWTVWMQPGIGGVVVGLMGIFYPDVMGVGYDYIDRVLNGDVVLQAVVVLAVFKIVATAVCYASGNAGGIFGPSLFMGGMFGAAVGYVANLLFPTYTADPGAYALVGMGTAFAGIVRTPMTSVIMIFELTRDYTIIVPLMISNMIAFVISYRLQRAPIYEALSHQDGIHLPSGVAEENRHAQVSGAMQPSPELLTPGTGVKKALELSRKKAQRLEALPVADRGRILGMIPYSKLEEAEADSGGKTVADIHEFPFVEGNDAPFPHLHPDHTLALALERMGKEKQNILPVVSRANVHQLLGVVSLDDILRTLGVHSPQESIWSSVSTVADGKTVDGVSAPVSPETPSEATAGVTTSDDSSRTGPGKGAHKSNDEQQPL